MENLDERITELNHHILDLATKVIELQDKGIDWLSVGLPVGAGLFGVGVAGLINYWSAKRMHRYEQDAARIQREIKTLEDYVRAVLALTNAFLEFSRWESPRGKRNKQPPNMNNVAVLEECYDLQQKYGISISEATKTMFNSALELDLRMDRLFLEKQEALKAKDHEHFQLLLGGLENEVYQQNGQEFKKLFQQFTEVAFKVIKTASSEITKKDAELKDSD